MKPLKPQAIAAIIGLLAGPVLADPMISKLPAGPHLGMIAGFDDLRSRSGEPERRNRADDLFQEAIEAGMTIGRAQIDWRNLEIAPGIYDAYTLAEALENAARDGLHVFVTFSSIDTEELALPDYLTADDGLPLNGYLLSDPEINTPFLAFLDWLIPELAKYDVWGLALGNEVDALIDAGVISEQETLDHLLAGVARVRSLDPELAVTVTLTGEANNLLPDFTDALLADLDIVSFNTYCLTRTLTVDTPRQWRAVVARWKESAGNKQIFIQELGCPVGYGTDQIGPNSGRSNGLNGSEALQSQFFEYYFDLFITDPQFRAATVFQLYDWSPDLSGIYEPIFAAEGFPLIGERLTEWLATVGLCRWSDTTCRPAWDVFLTNLNRLNQLRRE